MERFVLERTLNSITEELAGIEHERWSRWQSYMHSKGRRQNDGSILIPADLVRRWDRQAVTSYSELSESEKASDREQVRRYLPLIVDALSKPGYR